MPAILLIHRFLAVRKPITTELFADDINEKTSRGAPMPAPKARKLRMPLKKPDTERVALVRSAMIKAGLQGITKAPKKKPNRNALSRGFFCSGTFALGKILPKSTLKINSRLTTRRIPNAMGETT